MGCSVAIMPGPIIMQGLSVRARGGPYRGKQSRAMSIMLSPPLVRASPHLADPGQRGSASLEGAVLPSDKKIRQKVTF